MLIMEEKISVFDDGRKSSVFDDGGKKSLCLMMEEECLFLIVEEKISVFDGGGKHLCV